MAMYNYFMLIGSVQGFDGTDLKLKVTRVFGSGYDVFKIFIMDTLCDIAKDLPLNKKIVIKGRLVQTDELKLVAEQIIFI